MAGYKKASRKHGVELSELTYSQETVAVRSNSAPNVQLSGSLFSTQCHARCKELLLSQSRSSQF